MEIRREEARDAAAIAAVHAAAFAVTGSAGTVPAEVSLASWLRADGDMLAELSFVAADQGQVVGHVLCSRGHIDGTPAVGLGPLGVLPAWQRRGVGSALVHAAIAAADASGEVAVALLGDPLFYGRFGFVPGVDHGVHPPDPAWSAHFQLRRLSSWPAHVAGTFRYAPAFDRL